MSVEEARPLAIGIGPGEHRDEQQWRPRVQTPLRAAWLNDARETVEQLPEIPLLQRGSIGIKPSYLDDSALNSPGVRGMPCPDFVAAAAYGSSFYPNLAHFRPSRQEYLPC
jgi:hypothetical protein